MRHLALDVIRDEHQALAAMLRSLALLLQQSRRTGRLHHTKESELLFPKLRERAPELAPVLDRLDHDHAAGERAIRDIEHALLAFEVMGESRRQAFETAIERYIADYLAHMGREEADVLPAAQRLFSEADWAELDAAFAANKDPLTGHEPEDGYRPLFSKIVNAAPAPIGLG